MATYKISSIDDVYSASVNATGGLDNIVSFIGNKSNITYLEQDITVFYSQEISFPDELIQKKSPELIFKIDVIDDQISNFKGLYGQSTFDICNQYYGSLDSYVKFISDNNCDNKIDAEGLSGTFDKRFIKDYFVYERNSKFNIKYNTLAEIEVLNDVLDNQRVFEDGSSKIFENSELHIIN